MMDRVSEFIRTERLLKNLQDRRIVVWYDGEKAYENLLKDLSLEGVEVFRYAGSYFRLRHELEPFLEDPEMGMVLAYVPVLRRDTMAALIEADLTGTRLEPGHPDIRCNTSLSVVAREALRGVVGEEALDQYCRRAQGGELCLKDLDRIKPPPGQTGLLNLVYGSDSFLEIALAFLCDESKDADLKAKNAESDLEQLLGAALGFSPQKGAGLAETRKGLGRFLLLSDLVMSAPKTRDLPALSGVELAARGTAATSCRDLVGRWRDSEKRRTAYVLAAGSVEEEFSIGSLSQAAQDLLGCDTFPAIDSILQARAEEDLAKGEYEGPLKWAQTRRSGFWAKMDGRTAQGWAAIDAAAAVLKQAERVSSELKSAKPELPGLVEAYCSNASQGNGGWCALDRCHRQLLQAAIASELGDDFERALAAAQRRYAETAGMMSEIVHEALRKPATKTIPAKMQQTRIFEDAVRPRQEGAKVAYILVDALRYEMAQSFAESLAMKTSLEPALACVPSITPIGMGALMPGANKGLEVVAKGARAAVRIEKEILQSRRDRIGYLRKTIGAGFADAKLEEVVEGRRSVKQKAEEARFLLVTSQEIDEAGEADNPLLAHDVMDRILQRLRQCLSRLAEWGFDKAIVTADHGFLMGEKLGDERRMDAPEGETLELHRRVWIGKGGKNPEGSLRYSVRDFALEGDYDVIVPAGLSVFKAGGGLSYYHGGATLQERVIPVLSVRLSSLPEAPGEEGDVVIRLLDAQGKVRNRIFTVALQYQSLLGSSRRVSLIGRSGKNEVAGPVTAEHGFDPDTREIDLKRALENPVVMRLNQEASSIVLEVRDAATQRLLAKTGEIDVKLGV